MSPTPLTVRLPGWLDEELRSHLAEFGEGPSQGLRRVVEEWWARENFPAIEFRTGPAGRRAVLGDGPAVAEVVSAWRASDGDFKSFRQHFPELSSAQLIQARDYYARFPELVERAISEDERLKEYLERKREGG
ncbi:MAG: hypothetical protein ACREKN_01375 [Longimicrobiaceae bacterium]